MPLAQTHELLDVGGGSFDRPALNNVVDPALNDEHVRAVGRCGKARADLICAFSTDAVIAELDARVGERRPVQVLALGGGSLVRLPSRIRVVPGVPRGDRIP